MNEYIDGFVFSIPQEHLNEYKKAAEQIAEIWKEYGAISYAEFVGDDMQLHGTKSFEVIIDSNENDCVIIGWVKFPSKEVRDNANSKVRLDPRMHALVTPLINPEKMIFDASKMIYGGFKSFI